MKIAFHTNQLSLRGTEVAMYDYAKYAEELLGHTSIVLSKDPSVWKYSDPKAIEKFKNRFPVFFYKDPSEIEQILDDNNVDVFYAQKSGIKDNVVSKKRKTVIHAVFQEHEPHGEVYAYISEWLGKQYNYPFVPYMVDLPNEDGNLRESLDIPKNAIVYGRHGGYETFDIEFVKELIPYIAQMRPDIYFLFMNTERFGAPMKNIIFLDGTSDMIYKTQFINSCDAMLHARKRGESFGLAIAEFSLRNKPIITYSSAVDGAHYDMLGHEAYYYDNDKMLFQILMNAGFKNADINWNKYGNYTPVKVMEKFNEVFLK